MLGLFVDINFLGGYFAQNSFEILILTPMLDYAKKLKMCIHHVQQMSG